MNKPMTKSPSKKPGEGSYMKFLSAWMPYTDTWLVFKDDTVIEKNLSEDAATRLCQFLNASEYLNTDPRERNVRAEKINFDFNAIYSIYPRKAGKKLGIERLKKSVNTVEKYQLLIQAVENYASKMAGTEEKYIKHFSTWASSWSDDLPEDATPGDKSQLTMDDINKLMV